MMTPSKLEDIEHAIEKAAAVALVEGASTEARDHFASLHDFWLRLAAEIESGQSSRT